MHTKKELENMKKPELNKLVFMLQDELKDMSDKATKFEKAFTAAHEKIENLNEALAAAHEKIENLNESKIKREEEHKYSAYGRTGLSKEEYDQLLRDKST